MQASDDVPAKRPRAQRATKTPAATTAVASHHPLIIAPIRRPTPYRHVQQDQQPEHETRSKEHSRTVPLTPKLRRNHSQAQTPSVHPLGSFLATTPSNKRKSSREQKTADTSSSPTSALQFASQTPTSPSPRLTDAQRAEERCRKGRERSMRTRKRNAHRLKLLQDNCTHLHRENSVLRELVASVRRNAGDSVVAGLLRAWAGCRKARPPPHEVGAGSAGRAKREEKGEHEARAPGEEAKAMSTAALLLGGVAETATSRVTRYGQSRCDAALRVAARRPEPDDTMSSNRLCEALTPQLPTRGEDGLAVALHELGVLPALTVGDVVQLMGEGGKLSSGAQRGLGGAHED